MTYKKITEIDEDRIQKLIKARDSRIEITEHRKKLIPLQEEMTRALEQEILKQYKWKGKVWHDSMAERPYKATEIKGVAGKTCSESPIGIHVIPRHHEQADWDGVARSVCMCCGQKMEHRTGGNQGWMTAAERFTYTKKVKCAKKEGFRSLAEYEAWVAEEDKRRTAAMEELQLLWKSYDYTMKL